MDKSKKLVAYFSCTGTTARAASALAAAANAELFEIRPKSLFSVRFGLDVEKKPQQRRNER